MALIEICPAHFSPQVKVVSRERKLAAGVVNCARERVLQHPLKPIADAAPEGKTQSVTARGGRRFHLIDVEKIRIEPKSCPRHRRIDIARAQQMHPTQSHILNCYLRSGQNLPFEAQVRL